MKRKVSVRVALSVSHIYFPHNQTFRKIKNILRASSPVTLKEQTVLFRFHVTIRDVDYQHAEREFSGDTSESLEDCLVSSDIQ